MKTRTARWTAVAAVVAVGLIGLTQAWATDFTWAPTSGNDWGTAANWSPAGGPPGTVGATDNAIIPATATGTINYTVAGPGFNYTRILTTGATNLNININAAMTNDQANSNWGAGGENLVTTVNNGGSLTIAKDIFSVRGGQFNVESGGLVAINPNNNNANTMALFSGSRVTVRGTLATGNAYGVGDSTLQQATLKIDGGSVTMNGVRYSQINNKLELTANGGTLNIPRFGGGIRMDGWWPGGNYNATLTMAAGAINNESVFLVGGPNTDAASSPGTATATLSGGAINQSGYTALGDGRVGILNLNGATFNTFNNVYVGGGDYMQYSPKPTASASGTLNITAGSVSITNTPTSGSSTYIDSLYYLLHTVSPTTLRVGQPIVFTSLASQITGLSTGVTYYVASVSPYNHNPYAFQVAANPLGPAINPGSGEGSYSATWQTQYATLSVGNVGKFNDGDMVITGTLSQAGGTLTVDRLVATNGAASIVNFTGGTLNTKGTTITNGTAFTVGNGASAALLNLEGGAHAFANGLVLNTNAAFVVGGTNAIGAAASITGDVTFRANAIFDCDFNATTSDWTVVTGTVTLPATATLRARALDSSLRTPIPVLQATSISGSAAGWSTSTINGYNYRVVVSGNQLVLEKMPYGTAISIR
jgi:hypothetical protein